MKINKLILLFSLVFALSCRPAHAALVVTNILNVASYNGTNNSTSYHPAGRLSVNSQTLQVSNSALDSTNALLMLTQVSFDNTNFVTVATYQPSTTNATSFSFKPNLSTNVIYVRTILITTNAVTAGVVAVSEE